MTTIGILLAVISLLTAAGLLGWLLGYRAGYRACVRDVPSVLDQVWVPGPASLTGSLHEAVRHHR